MKIFRVQNRVRAITAVEVLMIITMLMILAVFLLPALLPARPRFSRLSCTNHLKQIGLAFKIWSGDNGDRFPMQVSTNDGGTREFVGTAAATFRHFEVMSNELNTPKILYCPNETDRARKAATMFSPSVPGIPGAIPFNGNSNISYFVGVDANQTNSAMFLSGDRNITNGFAMKNGLLDLGTNQLAGWTKEIHNRCGNILFSDGSVQQLTSPGLREALKETGVATTRLAMP